MLALALGAGLGAYSLIQHHWQGFVVPGGEPVWNNTTLTAAAILAGYLALVLRGLFAARATWSWRSIFPASYCRV